MVSKVCKIDPDVSIHEKVTAPTLTSSAIRMGEPLASERVNTICCVVIIGMKIMYLMLGV
jgi:hypothetical protein